MKILACAAAVALLLASGVLTPAARADTFFYGAVNETLFDCLDKYMPVDMPTGVIVPSKLLVDGGIGLRETFDPVSRVYTISDASYSLTFDIGRGLTYDSARQYDEKAFDTLTGVIYLPLDFIRMRFGLTYRFVEHGEYGIILRVCQGGVSPDSEFMSQVEPRLAQQQARYREINNLPPLPGVTAPVSPGAVTPAPSPIPVPAPPPEVMLVVDVTDAGAALLEDTLGVLDSHGVPAAVFFTRGALDRDHALTRRVLTRYTPGVLYDGPAAGEGGDDAVQEALDDANRVLRQAALTQTRFARLYNAAPNGGAAAETETAARLYQAGYRLWEQDIDLPAVRRERDIGRAAGDLMKKIEDGAGADGRVYVLRADCREFGPALLDALLTRLDDANAVFLEIGY